MEGRLTALLSTNISRGSGNGWSNGNSNGYGYGFGSGRNLGNGYGNIYGDGDGDGYGDGYGGNCGYDGPVTYTSYGDCVCLRFRGDDHFVYWKDNIDSVWTETDYEGQKWLYIGQLDTASTELTINEL